MLHINKIVTRHVCILEYASPPNFASEREQALLKALG